MKEADTKSQNKTLKGHNINLTTSLDYISFFSHFHTFF